MDAVAASSVNAVNQILISSNKAIMDQAEKMMKVAVAMGLEAGKGQNIDVTA